jgi:hypothetical protein
VGFMQRRTYRGTCGVSGRSWLESGVCGLNWLVWGLEAACMWGI